MCITKQLDNLTQEKESSMMLWYKSINTEEKVDQRRCTHKKRIENRQQNKRKGNELFVLHCKHKMTLRDHIIHHQAAQWHKKLIFVFFFISLNVLFMCSFFMCYYLFSFFLWANWYPTDAFYCFLFISVTFPFFFFSSSSSSSSFFSHSLLYLNIFCCCCWCRFFFRSIERRKRKMGITNYINKWMLI